jgi:hypothetical protein
MEEKELRETLRNLFGPSEQEMSQLAKSIKDIPQQIELNTNRIIEAIERNTQAARENTSIARQVLANMPKTTVNSDNENKDNGQKVPEPITLPTTKKNSNRKLRKISDEEVKWWNEKTSTRSKSYRNAYRRAIHIAQEYRGDEKFLATLKIRDPEKAAMAFRQIVGWNNYSVSYCRNIMKKTREYAKKFYEDPKPRKDNGKQKPEPKMKGAYLEWISKMGSSSSSLEKTYRRAVRMYLENIELEGFEEMVEKGGKKAIAEYLTAKKNSYNYNLDLAQKMMLFHSLKDILDSSMPDSEEKEDKTAEPTISKEYHESQAVNAPVTKDDQDAIEWTPTLDTLMKMTGEEVLRNLYENNVEIDTGKRPTAPMQMKEEGIKATYTTDETGMPIMTFKTKIIGRPCEIYAPLGKEAKKIHAIVVDGLHNDMGNKPYYVIARKGHQFLHNPAGETLVWIASYRGRENAEKAAMTWLRQHDETKPGTIAEQVKTYKNGTEVYHDMIRNSSSCYVKYRIAQGKIYPCSVTGHDPSDNMKDNEFIYDAKEQSVHGQADLIGDDECMAISSKSGAYAWVKKENGVLLGADREEEPTIVTTAGHDIRKIHRVTMESIVDAVSNEIAKDYSRKDEVYDRCGEMGIFYEYSKNKIVEAVERKVIF